MLARLNDFATGGMRPDRTFVLDFEAEAGLARTRERMRGPNALPPVSRVNAPSFIGGGARAFADRTRQS